MPWIILGVFVLLAGGAAAMLKVTIPIAKNVYNTQLVRNEPGKWTRVCSAPDNVEQKTMWDTGCAWAERYRDACNEVHIVHEGLNLYGELYLFGGTRCAIILPGRCECLKYSYYFAEPYRRAGMNVLVIDQRAHGNSDGTYNTIGAGESRDLLRWIDFLQKNYAMDRIWLHSICVGSSTAILAMTNEACPACVEGLTAEGCFISFRETFRRHMMDLHRPRFPVLGLVMMLIRKHTGTDTRSTAPIRLVKNLKQRVLFLFGEQDIFSVPKMSKRLYAKCGSPDKKLEWFPKGAHSHLRINNTEHYDDTIVEFVNSHENG